MAWKFGVLVVTTLIAGCAGDTAAIQGAKVILEAQLADDIQWSMREERAIVNRKDGFTYVCTQATLNRPNAGVLTLNNAIQEVIVTRARDGGGAALFSGSTTPEGRAHFKREWDRKCR